MLPIASRFTLCNILLLFLCRLETTNSDWVPWVSEGVQGLAGLDYSLVQDGGIHEGIFVKQHCHFNANKMTWVRPRTGHHRYQV